MAALPKDAQIVRFDDDAQAMAAMAAGQVDAYGVGNVPGSRADQALPGAQIRDQDQHSAAQLVQRRRAAAATATCCNGSTPSSSSIARTAT